MERILAEQKLENKEFMKFTKDALLIIAGHVDEVTFDTIVSNDGDKLNEIMKFVNARSTFYQ